MFSYSSLTRDYCHQLKPCTGNLFFLYFNKVAFMYCMVLISIYRVFIVKLQYLYVDRQRQIIELGYGFNVRHFTYQVEASENAFNRLAPALVSLMQRKRT